MKVWQGIAAGKDTSVQNINLHRHANVWQDRQVHELSRYLA
jgi:hypothetical protein